MEKINNLEDLKKFIKENMDSSELGLEDASISYQFTVRHLDEDGEELDKQVVDFEP